MSVQLVIKKNNTQGAVPTTGQIILGELTMNTYDGRIFFKKNVSGVETIVYVANLTDISGSTSLTASYALFALSSSQSETTVFAPDYTTLAEFNAFTSSIIFGEGFVTTSSFNAFTASYYLDSASFYTEISNLALSQSGYVTFPIFNSYTSSNDIRVTNVYASESNYLPTASYLIDSASFNTRINNLSGSGGVTGSFVTTGSFNTYTSSIAIQIANVYASESNYLLTSSFVNVGDISGSGITGYIPMFSGSTALTDSIIFESGSNSGSAILINGGATGSTNDLLQVYGGVYISSSAAPRTLFIQPASSVSASTTTTLIDSFGSIQIISEFNDDSVNPNTLAIQKDINNTNGSDDPTILFINSNLNFATSNFTESFIIGHNEFQTQMNLKGDKTSKLRASSVDAYYGSNIWAYMGMNPDSNNSGSLIIVASSGSVEYAMPFSNISTRTDFNNGGNVTVMGGVGMANYFSDLAIGSHGSIDVFTDFFAGGGFNLTSGLFTVGKRYGFRVIDLSSKVFVTDSYGFVSEGGADKNWFSGSLKLGGSTVPTGSLAQKLIVIGNTYLSGSLYDSTNSTGSVGQVLSTTATGILWATPVSGSSGSFVTIASFNAYTASTATLITNVFASESNYETTASFNTFSSSYVTDSSSFNSRITTVSSSFVNFSSSYVTDSSSFNVHINNVFASESNYESTASFNTYTSSIAIQISNVFASESNYLLTSSFVNIGDISGSGINHYIPVFSGSSALTSSIIYASGSGTGSAILLGAPNITGSNNATFQVFGSVYISQSLYDSTGNVGSSGQVLSSTGNSTLWINPSSSSPINTGSFVSTSSFNAYTSSTATQIANVYASESNYLHTSSLHLSIGNIPVYTGSNSFSASLLFQTSSTILVNGNNTGSTTDLFQVYGNVYISQSLRDSNLSTGSIGQVLTSDGNTLWLDLNNGLSDGDGAIILGQEINQAGDPGKLLFSTEIPMNANSFQFVDRTIGSGSGNVILFRAQIPTIDLYINESNWNYGPIVEFYNNSSWYQMRGVNDGLAGDYIFLWSHLRGSDLITSLDATINLVSGSVLINNLPYSLNGDTGSMNSNDLFQVYGNIYVSQSFRDSTLSTGSTGQILSSTSTGTQWIDNSGGGGGGNISGSGTDGTIAMFSGSTGIVNSNIIQNTTTGIVTMSTDVFFNGGILDSFGNTGSFGQVLGTLQPFGDLVSWVDVGVVLPITASNGLSISTGSIILGQAINAPGDPAKLTQNTEIPFDNQILSFVDRITGNYIQFVVDGAGPTLEFETTNISASAINTVYFVNEDSLNWNHHTSGSTEILFQNENSEVDIHNGWDGLAGDWFGIMTNLFNRDITYATTVALSFVSGSIIVSPKGYNNQTDAAQGPATGSTTNDILQVYGNLYISQSLRDSFFSTGSVGQILGVDLSGSLIWNDANNGLTSLLKVSSSNSDNSIVLGQPLGAIGDPAQLLFDTEIPMNRNYLNLVDRLSGDAISFFAGQNTEFALFTNANDWSADAPFFYLANKTNGFILIGDHDPVIGDYVNMFWAPPNADDININLISGSIIIWNNSFNNVPSGTGSWVSNDMFQIWGDTFLSGSLNQGERNTVFGRYSHVGGSGSVTIGDYSHAEGEDNVVNGAFSHVEGKHNSAGVFYSLDLGNIVFISASFVSIAGDQTAYFTTNNQLYYLDDITETILSASLLSIVFDTINTNLLTDANPATFEPDIIYSNVSNISNITGVGYAAHAEGVGNNACGNFSHAEGTNNIASGSAAHAEGGNTIASGSLSHAEGQGTVSVGLGSHAEGINGIAIGDYSHAEGFESFAIGLYSHAEGNNTVAMGDISHTEGIGTIAAGTGQSVIGKYNTTSSNVNPLFIIGNGQNDLNRSDLGLFYSGSIIFNSSLLVSSSLILSSSIVDISGSTGTPGQVLSPVSGGVQWINQTSLNTISGSFSSGSSQVTSVLSASYSSMFVNYVVSSGSNQRAGEFISSWISGSMTYSEFSTTDIGSSSPVTFSSSFNGQNTAFNIVITSGTWKIKSIIETI